MTPSDRDKLLADVDGFCQEIRPHEELCYVEHRFNDQVVPLAKKHNILGMFDADGIRRPRRRRGHVLARPSRGSAARGPACARSSPARSRSAQYPILTWGTADQKQRYLPAACRGEKILAFGLTEPDAGSNPLEMTTTYERRGDKFVLNGVKYLISNGGIADAVICFGYPANRPPDAATNLGVHRRYRRSRASSPKTLTAKMGMFAANTAMFELHDAEVPVEQPARRGRRRLPHRDGHARERPAQRGRRLPRA